MPPKREIKDLKFETEARAIILAGVEKGYRAVSSTFGPAANNVLQGMPYGDPVLTRDGVTVAKRVILANAAENDAWAVMRQASEQTNKSAGDGTTSTIVLGYNLLKEAHQYVVAGQNAMILKKQIEADAEKVVAFIESKSKKADDHLLEVATVSSGDSAIGAMVADTMKEIGLDAGITIREQSYPTLNVEKVDGYYFNKGWNVLNTEVAWEKPNILVSQKALRSNIDVLPLINFIMKNIPENPKLLIIGEVTGEALQTLLQNTMAQVDTNGHPFPFECLIISPPAFGDDSKLFMEDIAIYTGATLITEASSLKDIKLENFGTAERTQLNNERGILFHGGGAQEDIDVRAHEIKDNMDKESNEHSKEQYEQRYSKLRGKIAIVNVGGATPTEMEELRFRVEDAIEATKSAMADGVVVGGGTLYVHASGLDISPLFSKALRETFNKLMDNAAQPADYRFEQIKKAKAGYGFNLRSITDAPVDLAEAGIWDATRAITQTVQNAVSSACALLTVDTIITPVDEKDTSKTA